jgi:Fe-S cluster assembly iron-binding protein IscA
MGVTLDYVDDVHGSGFVFNNPNNAKTCGCGGGGHH